MASYLHNIHSTSTVATKAIVQDFSKALGTVRYYVLESDGSERKVEGTGTIVNIPNAPHLNACAIITSRDYIDLGKRFSFEINGEEFLVEQVYYHSVASNTAGMLQYISGDIAILILQKPALINSKLPSYEPFVDTPSGSSLTNLTLHDNKVLSTDLTVRGTDQGVYALSPTSKDSPVLVKTDRGSPLFNQEGYIVGVISNLLIAEENTKTIYWGACAIKQKAWVKKGEGRQKDQRYDNLEELLRQPKS